MNFPRENGTLTASMKLRRRVVAERYRQQIEEMYEQAEAAGTGGLNRPVKFPALSLHKTERRGRGTLNKFFRRAAHSGFVLA